MDGQLVPYQEIETETLQVDDITVRTTTRTFGRDINGGKSLVQVTEEEKHLLAGGDSNVVRITFNPDVNGKLQEVQHEVTETKVISKDVEETNTTVMLPNINGGLDPAFKTRERQERGTDGRARSEKTTLLADGAGKWEVAEKRQVTTIPEAANQTMEERVFRRDAEGNLVEISRTETQEMESVSGEKRQTIETYSLDISGASRDGKLHLVERTATAQHTTTAGEQVTEKTVEELNPGNPSSGLRISVMINNRMVPIPSGGQSTLVIRERDPNGRFAIVAVDTTMADRIPVLQVQEASGTPK